MLNDRAIKQQIKYNIAKCKVRQAEKTHHHKRNIKRWPPSRLLSTKNKFLTLLHTVLREGQVQEKERRGEKKRSEVDTKPQFSHQELKEMEMEQKGEHHCANV